MSSYIFLPFFIPAAQVWSYFSPFQHSRERPMNSCPDPPKNLKNRSRDAPKRHWSVLEHPKRLRNAPGTLPERFGDASGRSRTLSGRSRTLPRRSRDAPGTLPGHSRDAPGTLPGRHRCSMPIFDPNSSVSGPKMEVSGTQNGPQNQRKIHFENT